MNKKNLYTIAGGLFGITMGVFAFKIYRAYQDKKKSNLASTTFSEEQNTNTLINGNTQPSIGAKESKDSLPLKVGSFGYKVSLLQSALNKLGASLTVDGKFGEETYNAIGKHGRLEWYDWTYACNVGYWCELSQKRYNEILSNATKKGWSKEQAKVEANLNWKEFVMSGDDWVYNNLKLN